MMPVSYVMVEAALYCGLFGLAILVLSLIIACGGLLIYLMFGW